MRDSAAFAADPWAADALTGIDPDAPVLLLGTGLTMVDIALKLAEEGHRGPMLAVSRRGLLPGAHRYGGHWEPFLAPKAPPGSPNVLLLAWDDLGFATMDTFGGPVQCRAMLIRPR